MHPVFTRAPRNREHEERPAGGRAKNAGVQETSIWRTVIYGVQYVTAMYNTSYLRLWLRPNKLSDIRPISRIEFVRRSSYVSVVNGRACSVVGDHTNLLQLGCEPILSRVLPGISVEKHPSCESDVEHRKQQGLRDRLNFLTVDYLCACRTNEGPRRRRARMYF